MDGPPAGVDAAAVAEAVAAAPAADLARTERLAAVVRDREAAAGVSLAAVRAARRMAGPGTAVRATATVTVVLRAVRRRPVSGAGPSP